MSKHQPDLSFSTGEQVVVSDVDVGYGAARYDRNYALNGHFHKRSLEITRDKTLLRFLFRDKLTKRVLKKFFYIFIQNHGFKRTWNFIKFLVQRKKTASVSYMPPHVLIDITNKCNLRCPGCSTGLNLGRKRGAAEFATVAGIIDQISDTTLQLGFFHWGEPLINNVTYDAISHARNNGIWTFCSTNLSFPIEKYLSRIFECGLHDIVISCDGVTQKIYEKYRVGGDVELVFDNLRKIRSRRDQLGYRIPYLRAKMIVFEHNWHEIEIFRDRALSAGADEVLYTFGYGAENFSSGRNGSDSYFHLPSLSWIEINPQGPCTEIWKEMFFSFDGAVFPCCLGHRDSDLFAPPPEDGCVSVKDVWTSRNYISARRYFLGEDTYEQLVPGCKSCRFVENYKK